MKKRQNRLETKRNKQHHGDIKLKAMEYYNIIKTRLQTQSCNYYRNLSEEEKERKKKELKVDTGTYLMGKKTEKKKKRRSNKNIINQERIIIANN